MMCEFGTFHIMEISHNISYMEISHYISYVEISYRKLCLKLELPYIKFPYNIFIYHGTS